VKLIDGTEHPYGFGWHVDNVADRRFVFHGGAWQGFKSFIGRFPDDRLTIIFFANLWDTRDFKLAGDLASFFYPRIQRPAVPTIEDTDPKTTRLVRDTLLQISAGNAKQESFSVEAHANILPQKVRQLEKTLRSLSIPVAVIFMSELIDQRNNGRIRTFRYLLSDVTKSFICTITLNSDDKITELDIEPNK